MYKSGRQLGIWNGTSHVILSFSLALPQNYHLVPSPVLSSISLPSAMAKGYNKTTESVEPLW